MASINSYVDAHWKVGIFDGMAPGSFQDKDVGGRR
jgi:hypothetical protein